MNDADREAWAIIKDGMITPDHLVSTEIVPAAMPVWTFKRLDPSGTVVARDPRGAEFVVKDGRFDTAAGRELLNAMIAALSGQ